MHMTRHLREAIALNKARAPLYAQISQGRTRTLSRRLILAEYCLLPVAWWVDAWDGLWARRGLPVLDRAFAEMSAAPAFRETFPETVSDQPFQPLEISGQIQALRQTIQEARFEDIVDQATTLLETLHTQPRYHRMTFHVVESLRRLAWLAQSSAAEAKARGLRPPLRLLRVMLQGHLWLLPRAQRLDRDAAPLQAEGIPFLYYDLPPIPADPRAQV